MMSSTTLQVVLSLLLVITLIFVMAYVYKKYLWSRYNYSQKILVLAILPLGVKQRIVLIECEKQKFLLGVSSENISLIQAFPVQINN